MRKLSLALVAAAGILAGCSGGGSKVASSVPSGPAQAVTLSASIDASNKTQSGTRSPKYIPASAVAVSITVFGPNATGPASAPGPVFSQTCATIPAGTTQVNLQVSAPAATDVFLIQSWNGPCAAATATGSVGTGTVLSSLQTAPVVVAVTSTNLNQVVTGSNTGALTLAVPVSATAGANTLTGSLSLLSTVTSFAIDPGVKEGMLLTLTIKDNAGNTLTSPAGSGSVANCVTVAQTGFTTCAAGQGANPIGATTAYTATSASIPLQGTGLQLVVKDTKAPNGSSNHFSLGQIVTSGTTYDPAQTGCGGGGCANGTLIAGSNTPGTAAVNTLNVTNAPAAGTGFVLFYDGSSQDIVTGATVTLQTNASTPTVLATLAVTNQAEVITPATAALSTVASGGVADIGGVLTAGGQATKFVAASNKIARELPTGTLAYTESDTAGPNAGDNFTGLAWNLGSQGPGPGVDLGLATDSNCSLNGAGACGGGTGTFSSGIFTFTNAGGPVIASITEANCAGCPTADAAVGFSFLNTLGNGQAKGPVGVYSFPSGMLAGTATFPSGITALYNMQTAFVASNNSIYKITLNNTSTAITATTLLAGSGNTTNAGTSAGYVDSAQGNNARLNFGTSPFIGMTSDAVGKYASSVCGLTAAGSSVVATQLFVGDFFNKTIRKVSLTPPYGVTSIGQAFGLVNGITYDQCNGQLVITNQGGDQNNNIYTVNPATGAFTVLVTGTGTAAGGVDGVGAAGYPLQFLSGNAMSKSTGGNAYGNGLGANSIQTSGQATTNAPIGIDWDGVNGNFYFVDSANAGRAFRVAT